MRLASSKFMLLDCFKNTTAITKKIFNAAENMNNLFTVSLNMDFPSFSVWRKISPPLRGGDKGEGGSIHRTQFCGESHPLLYPPPSRGRNTSSFAGMTNSVHIDGKICQTAAMTKRKMPEYWEEAARHLSRKDKVLKKIIANYPGELLASEGD